MLEEPLTLKDPQSFITLAHTSILLALEICKTENQDRKGEFELTMDLP